MTAVLLANALKKLLDEKLTAYTYTDSSGNTRRITTYTYYLDDKQPGGEDVAPYIVIRPVSGEDDVENSTAKCILVACVRDEAAESGYLGAVNLLERIRQIILTTGTIDKKFPLKRPLKWGIDNEPNRPYYSGYIEVNYYVGHLDDFQKMPMLYE
ncbi:hypothetical protein [uncultured Megasphaera sp.]|uniref:hypothetical protein n=1 Tax=uncultured Megasphaera sp. TaxID=165188 RepID=UPI00266C0DF8|nr:hypothetical protein [uncultured Megasphaera sp.]